MKTYVIIARVALTITAASEAAAWQQARGELEAACPSSARDPEVELLDSHRSQRPRSGILA